MAEQATPASAQLSTERGLEAETPICSAKGCRVPAVVELLWRNPRLHARDRRKSWPACAAHEQFLAQFLAVRGFLRETEPLS